MTTLLLLTVLASTPPPIQLGGDEAALGRGREALPHAVRMVEQRLGEVPWSGLEVRLTTSGAERGVSPAPAWADAYALPAQGYAVVYLDRIGSYPHSSLIQVMAHELAHLASHRLRRGATVPRWFEEGMAMSAAREVSTPERFHLARALVFGDDLTLVELDGRFHGDQTDAQAAYALSASFVRWIEQAGGPGTVRRIVDAVAAGVPFPAAVRGATGATLPALEDAWRRHAVVYYRWVPIVTSSATLWMSITVLALLAWLRKRKQLRERAARWELEEAEEEWRELIGRHGPH